MKIKNSLWYKIFILTGMIAIACMSTIATAAIVIENAQIPAPGGEVHVSVVEGTDTGYGISGYDFIVSLSDPSVAEIKDVIFPEWASLTTKGVSSPGSLRVSAVDLTNQVKGTNTNVPLLTLVIRGKAPGSSMINLDVKKIDDDSGNPLEKDYTPGMIKVGGEVVTEKPTTLPQFTTQAETTLTDLTPSQSPAPDVTLQEVTPLIAVTPTYTMEINFTTPEITNITTSIPTTVETAKIEETGTVSTNVTENLTSHSTPLTPVPTTPNTFSIAGIFPFSLLLPNITPQTETTQVIFNTTTPAVTVTSNVTPEIQVTETTTKTDNETGGQFVLSSLPSTAEVYIEGSFIGITPLKATNISPGSHEILVKMEGYDDYKLSAFANPGKITQVPLVILKPKSGDTAGLIVSSLPPDADIYLNGNYFGRTPITLKDLPAGKTEILLNKPGYRDAIQGITLIAGVTSRVADIPLYPSS